MGFVGKEKTCMCRITIQEKCWRIKISGTTHLLLIIVLSFSVFRTCIEERNRNVCTHSKSEKVLYVQLSAQELNFAVSLGYQICEILDTYYWNSGGMYIFHDFIKSCEAFKNRNDSKIVSSLIKSGMSFFKPFEL